MPVSARTKALRKSLPFAPKRRPIISKAQWTLAEITVLRDMYAAGKSAAEIAASVGRSKKGVYAVAKLRGLTFGVPRTGVPDEAAILGEPAVDPPVRDFAVLIGAARYEDDPRSIKPQPGRVFYRPATHVDRIGSLA